LIFMLWNDSTELETEITIASAAYRSPVRVNLFDLNAWSDIDSSTNDTETVVRLTVGQEPAILRFFKFDSVR
jgi:hypothetical protein